MNTQRWHRADSPTFFTSIGKGNEPSRDDVLAAGFRDDQVKAVLIQASAIVADLEEGANGDARRFARACAEHWQRALDADEAWQAELDKPVELPDSPAELADLIPSHNTRDQ